MSGSLRQILKSKVKLSRRASSLKNAETALSWFLKRGKYPAGEFFRAFRDEALKGLPPKAFETYRGRKVVIVDPTPYAKRSRVKRKHRMEYVSKVKVDDKVKPGYLDIWAGVLLKGGFAMPLERKIFSNRHPDQLSQNQVEEEVIREGVEAVGGKAIVVADRGFRRKALLNKLIERKTDFVIRLAEKTHVLRDGKWQNIL